MSKPRKIVVTDQEFAYTLNARYEATDGTRRIALTLFRAESRRRAFAFCLKSYRNHSKHAVSPTDDSRLLTICTHFRFQKLISNKMLT